MILTLMKQGPGLEKDLKKKKKRFSFKELLPSVYNIIQMCALVGHHNIYLLISNCQSKVNIKTSQKDAHPTQKISARASKVML